MKKSLKKITALTLTALLLFSLTACAKKKSAKEVMEASIQKSKEMKDFDMTGNMKYKVQIGGSSSDDKSSDSGSSLNLNMKFDAKATLSDKDKIQMAMQMSTDMFGQSIKMNAYYNDGYYYIDSSGQKLKMKMNIEDLEKELESSTGQNSLPIKYYKDLKLEEKDNQQTIQYSLNQDGLEQYLKEVMSQMDSITGSASSADQIKISSFSGTRTVNEDYYPVKETIKLVMDTGQKELGEISMDMSVTYKNIGKKVKVTLPNDLSSYTETSSQTRQTQN